MSVSRYSHFIVLLALLGAGNGCVALREYTSDCVTRVQAGSAYRNTACPPDCRHDEKHYARGWKQGYINVAQGGEGCAPPLPPDRYQSCVYQCSEGQAAIRSWYCGYQDGAHAAFACGVQQYNYVPSPACSAPPQSDPGFFDGQHEVLESSAEPMPEPQAMHTANPAAAASDFIPLPKPANDLTAGLASAATEKQFSSNHPDATLPTAVVLHRNPLRATANVGMRTAQIGQ